MEGAISNDEFAQKFPRNQDDPALRAIYSEMWFFYSDTFEHRLSGKYALNEEQRANFERCLLFLRSNLEFQWPRPAYRLRYGIIRLLGFGRLLKRREKREMSVGDLEVWPFLRKPDYQVALAKAGEPKDAQDDTENASPGAQR
jgi:hypothetical protein